MRCDGKILLFEGQRDNKGNRVQIQYQTKKLWCNQIEIELNRRVMFFDDASPVEPKAVKIRCAHDVHVEHEQLDAQGKRTSVGIANCLHLQYDVEKNYISAAGPGDLSLVFCSTGQGFDNNLAGTPGTSDKLNYLAVGFMDKMQGTMLGNNKEMDMEGRVKAIYCPAAGWEDRIGLDNFMAARKTGYTLECERLHIAEVPNPVNLSQSSMELTASVNAIIDGSGIWGRARMIKYNQAKSMVYLDDDVKLRSPSTQSEISAQSIHYNIETRMVELMQSQGFSIGQ